MASVAVIYFLYVMSGLGGSAGAPIDLNAIGSYPTQAACQEAKTQLEPSVSADSTKALVCISSTDVVGLAQGLVQDRH
jgi:hypothetical protein